MKMLDLPLLTVCHRGIIYQFSTADPPASLLFSLALNHSKQLTLAALLMGCCLLITDFLLVAYVLL